MCTRILKLNYPTSANRDDWIPMILTDHGDVGMVVPPKRVLRVDQMRQIEREANYRPFEGKARVFMIDEADKLNDNSANALLKVLEEPPSTSHLILITSRPAMLAPNHSLTLSDDQVFAVDTGLTLNNICYVTSSQMLRQQDCVHEPQAEVFLVPFLVT